jgi:hypothetical protein
MSHPPTFFVSPPAFRLTPNTNYPLFLNQALFSFGHNQNAWCLTPYVLTTRVSLNTTGIGTNALFSNHSLSLLTKLYFTTVEGFEAHLHASGIFNLKLKNACAVLHLDYGMRSALFQCHWFRNFKLQRACVEDF